MNKNKKKVLRLFVDMDGTLCKWGNVSSEEELYREGYFRNLEPTPLVEHIKTISDMNDSIFGRPEVYILTHFLPDSANCVCEKKEWIEKYLPGLKENALFVPRNVSKADYFESVKNSINCKDTEYVDVLIDDYTENLLAWSEKGYESIKVLNGINHSKGTWTGYMFESNNRVELLGILCEIYEMNCKEEKNFVDVFTFKIPNKVFESLGNSDIDIDVSNLVDFLSNDRKTFIEQKEISSAEYDELIFYLIKELANK